MHSSQLVQKVFDVANNEFVNLLDSISKKVTWHDFDNSLQSSIQTRIGDSNDAECCGETVNIQRKGIEESVYCNLLNIYRGTCVDQLLDRLGEKVTRLRWMGLKHKSCYSVHSDLKYRLHIPVVTNEHCFFVFPEKSECIRLEPGSLYFVNTKLKHTFFNGGTEIRWHLVGNIG